MHPHRKKASFIEIERLLLLLSVTIAITSSCSRSNNRNVVFAAAALSRSAFNRNNKKIQSLESLLELEADLHTRGYKYVIGSDDSGGAGCIAGPVVVASCCVLQPYSSLFGDILTSSPSSHKHKIIDGLTVESSDITLPRTALNTLAEVNDCKVLTTIQHQEIYDIIKEHPNVFAITTSLRSPQQIDELNLLQATQEAFAESIEALVEQYKLPYESCYAIVDGKISPKLYAEQREEESDAHYQKAFQKRFSVRPYVNGDGNVFVVSLASIVARVTRDAIMKELHELHPDYYFDDNKGYGSKSHIDALHRLGSVRGVHRMSFKKVKGR
jgi:ribonuclease HII